ncbi:hypothetical protein AOLI_G00038300 [Acnodon oligacanthus]
MNRSEAKEFPQTKTLSSSYTGSNYYNLIWDASIKETDEEDDLLKYPELENGRREWKVHSSPIPLELKQRQYARKKLIYDLCDSNGTLGFNEKWQTIDDVPNWELANLLVDDRHGIIYCYVPKVACTEWKRIMIVLSESLKVNGVPYRDPSDIPMERIHGNSIQYLNRLISAFRNKFQKENQPFYKRYAIPIMKKFGKIPDPPASVKEALAAGIAPSFSNFIQYILSLPADKYELLDEHWRQMAHLCHPCQIHYDFIGKMETMEEAHLLRMLRVDNIVQFPKIKSSITDANWTKTWFPNIAAEWRRKLFKLFETDYKLFGYQVPEYLLLP